MSSLHTSSSRTYHINSTKKKKCDKVFSRQFWIMSKSCKFLGVTVTGYIRGCFDRMLIKGFNQTIVRLNRWLQRDSCQYYNKQEVLQSSLHHHTSSKSNMIYICTCYSDGCNGSHGLNGAINITLILQKHLLTVGGLIAVWTWSIKVTR